VDCNFTLYDLYLCKFKRLVTVRLWIYAAINSSAKDAVWSYRSISYIRTAKRRCHKNAASNGQYCR